MLAHLLSPMSRLVSELTSLELQVQTLPTSPSSFLSNSSELSRSKKYELSDYMQSNVQQSNVEHCGTSILAFSDLGLAQMIRSFDVGKKLECWEVIEREFTSEVSFLCILVTRAYLHQVYA